MGNTNPEGLLFGLSAEQREAVLAPEGPLLVLAGAGSGKTRALTHRIAHAIAAGWRAPEEVLAITFTNRAAQELQDRLCALVGEGSARRATVGTFHSVSHRLLRPRAEAVGRTRGFSIYDQQDAGRVFAEACKEAGVEPDDREHTRRAVSLAKSRLEGPEAVAEGGAEGAAAIAEAYERYEALLEASDALDFDDLIGRCCAVFERAPEALSEAQRRFGLVLVDEYQDTNVAQYRWVRAVAAAHRNLTVVGDDDQSIYRFRGADVGNIWAFERDYAEARVVCLGRNYRSTEPIVAAAVSLISCNEQRKYKELRSARGPGAAVRHGTYTSPEQEASAAATWCVRALERGVADIGLLYRLRFQGQAVERALVLQRVPFRVVGGTEFFETGEVKDCLAYLQLAANPRDVVALARCAQAPKRGTGPAAIEHTVAHARMHGITPVAALSQAEAIQGLGARQRKGLLALSQALGAVAAAGEQGGLSQAVEAACTKTGLVEALRRERSQRGRRKVERLRELVRTARAYEAAEAEPSIPDFLATARLAVRADEEGGPEAAVTLSTVHMAKGAEWQAVRVVGLSEGQFPHHRALAEGDGALEEERRLAYVALTRAGSQLALSAPLTDSRGGQRAPSRFLEECGALEARRAA